MHRITVILLLGIHMALGQTNGFCNLVWSDEFNGNSLSSDWTKEVTCNGGGNNELECYTARDKNVYLQNGVLVLHAYRETYTGSQSGCTDTSGCTNTQSYTSGRVNTANSHSFLQRRFETRAKLPSGTHLWPAIWMLPTDWVYGGWAASGEIDIMESRGDHPDLVSGTLHHGAAWPNNVYDTTGDHGINVDLSQDFHVYALEWTGSTMKWFIDDYNFQTYDLNRWWNVTANGVYSKMGQPWDQRFHFILNLAVGGGFFGGYPALTDAQAAAWANPTMQIDYVRAYSYGGSCNGQVATSTSTSAAATPTSAAATPTVANDNGNRPVSATCNGQSYDANAYTCTINEQGLQRLCPSGQSACGSACYPSASYCCLNGALVQKSFCPAVVVSSTSQAAVVASSTTTHASTSTSASSSAASVATQGSSNTVNSCNGQLFGSGYTCTTNDQGNKLLCPTSHPSGCGQACYSSDNYCCKNSQLQPAGHC